MNRNYTPNPLLSRTNLWLILRSDRDYEFEGFQSPYRSGRKAEEFLDLIEARGEKSMMRWPS